MSANPMRAVVRWLASGDWFLWLLGTIAVGLVIFLLGAIVAAGRSGWQKEIPDNLIPSSCLYVIAVLGCGFLFFWQVWPRLVAWAEREPSHGHRKSNSGDRSQAGAPTPAFNITSYGTAATGASAGEVGARTRVVVEQEIIAKRGWSLSQDAHGPVLWSLVQRFCWLGPSERADVVPSRENTNGIYGLADWRGDIRKSPVIGTVALSGVVVEGESGYRAERAIIRSLTIQGLPPETPVHHMGSGLYGGGAPQEWRVSVWAVAEQLAARYQCDVTIDWTPTSDLPAQELVI